MRLLSTGTIAAASAGNLSAVATSQGPAPDSLAIQANFLYGSGGTTVDAYVQTSFDGGGTWTDIANFHFTTSAARRLYNLSRLTSVTSIATPTDGSISNNTSVDGLLGSQFRVKWTTTGTYGGATSLAIDIAPGRARVE
jgi:hypothetical protein